MMTSRPAFLIACAALAVVAGCNAPSNVTEEETASLIQPVARVALGAAQTVAKGMQTGEQVYTAVCASCHGSGALNAPKVGDTAAWAPRLALGLDGLTKSAVAGKGQMPARGGNAELTDEEVARAIAFMANQSGASFKEPPVAVAAN